MTPPPILLVSANVWRVTSELFSKYASKRVEAGCFWYGHRDEEKAIAVLVGVHTKLAVHGILRFPLTI